MQDAFADDEAFIEEANAVDAAEFGADEKQYDWIADAAPKHWESKVAAYQKLDDKAGSLLTWVSSGTGLFTAGLTLAVADGKVPWGVALLFAPSLLYAVRSCVACLLAREARILFPPPDVRTALVWVERYGKDAKARLLTEWHKASIRLNTLSNARADSINRSLRFSAWAVWLLALPLAGATLHAAHKWWTMAPPAVMEIRESAR